MNHALTVRFFGNHTVLSEQHLPGPHALRDFVHRYESARLLPRYSPSGRRLMHRGAVAVQIGPHSVHIVCTRAPRFVPAATIEPENDGAYHELAPMPTPRLHLDVQAVPLRQSSFV